MRLSSDFGVWVAAVSSLGVYSFLMKENPVSRFIEFLFVGLAAGLNLTMGFINLKSKALDPIITGKDPVMLIPLAIGLLLFTRFIPGQRHLGRIPMALMTGIGTGLTLRGIVVADFVGQIRAAITPLNSLDTVVVFLGTLGTITYFFFTIKPSKFLSAGASVGKWVMMVAFGAGFGNATMGRISQLIGRLDLILGQWLGLYVK